jgi:hypothetical protein
MLHECNCSILSIFRVIINPQIKNKTIIYFSLFCIIGKKMVRNQKTWILILALPLLSCLDLGKSVLGLGRSWSSLQNGLKVLTLQSRRPLTALRFFNPYATHQGFITLQIQMRSYFHLRENYIVILVWARVMGPQHPCCFLQSQPQPFLGKMRLRMLVKLYLDPFKSFSLFLCPTLPVWGLPLH